jgi:hypothetical protein
MGVSVNFTCGKLRSAERKINRFTPCNSLSSGWIGNSLSFRSFTNKIIWSDRSSVWNIGSAPKAIPVSFVDGSHVASPDVGNSIIDHSTIDHSTVPNSSVEGLTNHPATARFFIFSILEHRPSPGLVLHSWRQGLAHVRAESQPPPVVRLECFAGPATSSLIGRPGPADPVSVHA